MFELSAFTHEIRSRLSDVQARVDARNWQPLGEKFFAVLVRARYATSSPEFRQPLLSAGVPKQRLEPFNITKCIRGLAAEPDRADAVDRYAQLCDFVHQNLSSALTTGSGHVMSDHAKIGSGIVLMPDSGPVAIYRYPVGSPFVAHVDRAGPGFLRDAEDCIRWINETPSAPFEYYIDQVGNVRALAVE